MDRALIIGATGTVGRQVVSQMRALGAPVRALARNPEVGRDARASLGKAALPPDVETVRGDLTDPESLDRCLAGIDRVFLVWNAPPAGVEKALERIAKHARRIVFLSSPYKTDHPFFQRSQPNAAAALHAKIEQLIVASNVQWTFLRPGMFAANALHWWAPQIRAGNVVRWPCALAATAPVHEHDIAAVAVRALCEESHRGAEYVLTGPESLTQAEQISAIGRAIGRPLRLEEIPRDEAQQELFARFHSAPIVKMLLDAWDGATGLPALVTPAVEEITGTPPRTFFEWATEHAAQFRG